MIIDMNLDKAPKDSRFGLISMSEMKANPFSARVDVYEGDEYWDGEQEYANLNPDQEREMRQFINSLRGTSGQFYFNDIVHQQKGTWGGSIVVDGNNQDGIVLAVRGAVPNELIAPYGDRFQLGEHLYELMEDAVADADGRATLNFLPDIRVIATDGTALITDNPRCKCMLYPNQKPPQGTTKKARLSSYKFKFRESLR